RVALSDLFIRDGCVLPISLNGRITIDAELNDKARPYAKEAATVVVAVLDEIVETIRSLRRPLRMDFDDKDARRCFEFCFVHIWRALVQCGRFGKCGFVRLTETWRGG